MPASEAPKDPTTRDRPVPEFAPQPLLGDTPAACEERIVREALWEGVPPAREAELLLRLGLCLQAQGRHQEATAALKRAALGEDDEIAARALIQLLEASVPTVPLGGLLARAERRASASKQPAVVVDIAAVLVESGNAAQAARLLERVREEGQRPAPRSAEEPSHRRARALAALRLAELRAADSGADQQVDELLQEAVDANEPTVTPRAALLLAERRRRRPAQGCAEDELLRIAWAYDHPTASPQAGRRLVEAYLERGQHAWAAGLLEALAVRGDEATAAWARERLADIAASALASAEPPPLSELWAPPPRRHRTRTLVLGAGSGARRVLNEIDSRRVQVVGVLDDDHDGTVEGHAILGRIDELPRVLCECEVDRVWLAVPSAGPELRHRVGIACAEASVGLRVLPNPFELVADRNYVRQLRPLRVEETYGDDGRRIAIDQVVGAVVRERSVMVVGAGGRIGAELARQIVRERPRHLALVGRDESALIELDEELREERRFKWTFLTVADAARRSEIRTAMQLHRPDVVFLAGGFDHARVAETNLVQAARVNVLGAWIAAQEAAAAGAETVLLLSNDNAAQRSCPFDWTKAAGEQAAISVARAGARVCAVRLPNVFRASGSVVQRFERQVRTGGAVTVIDASARRHYLNLHEAAHWLLRVAAIAEPGAIYAVDAGVEVEILELAHRIARLHGLEPDRDVPVRFVSPRQGEKRSTRLWGVDEQLVETSVPEVVRVLGTPWGSEELEAELRRAEEMVDPNPAYVRELLRRPFREHEERAGESAHEREVDGHEAC